MKNVYSTILKNSIENEIAGKDYHYDSIDRDLLQKMFSEINSITCSDYHYLAEVDLLLMSGAGEIMAKYLFRFHSESIRGYIIPHLVSDRVNQCSQLVFQSYQHFKSSSVYLRMPDGTSPSHIYVRYDNAFSNLKPRAMKQELVQLVKSPRDAFYLPLTTRMLASWKIPEMETVLQRFLSSHTIDYEMIELTEKDSDQLFDIRRELLFNGLEGIKYYPSITNVTMLEKFLNSSDKDICQAAKKAQKYMRRRINNQ